MVFSRESTAYWRIQDEPGEEGIELQQNRKHAQSMTFDGIIESVRHESTLEVPGTTSARSAHDAESLLQPKSVSSQHQRNIQQRFLSGWRVGALGSLIVAVCVALINVFVTIFVVTNHDHEDADPAILVLYKGSCQTTKRLDVVLHLAINILSTLLLCSSNYCMQVLSAPNREELVRAHSQRFWLHIGVPSIRNLKRIGKDRAFLWFLLVSTSVPLHLLFNSTIFTNLQANNYVVIPATEDWLNGGTYNTSGIIDGTDAGIKNVTTIVDSLRINATDRSSNTPYKKMTVNECFQKYSGQYLSDWGNAILIQDEFVWRNASDWAPYFNRSDPNNITWTWTNNKTCVYDDHGKPKDGCMPWNNTGDIFPYDSDPNQYPSNGWRCASRDVEKCDVDNPNEVPKDRSKWAPYGSPLKYCMVEEVEEQCKLHFSLPIAILVIASNCIKAACIGLTLFRYKKHHALVTLGDAIATFLDHPDPETVGRCLHSRSLMEAEWNWEYHNMSGKDDLTIEPEQYNPARQRWARAPSTGRWWATYTFYTAAIVVGIVFSIRSSKGMATTFSRFIQTGLGTINGNNLLSMNTSVMGGILLANLPQAVLSYMYLAFNALYTSMFVAKEWFNYSKERKALRVTSPVGKQRSTYWLNVPFRYAFPMTVMSSLFHWLASQSIFLVQISVTDPHTREVVSAISTCGYSPVAVILTVLVGTIIAAGGIGMGFFRYPAGMPMAGSCSAAISAGCHPPTEDVDASVLPVQWGAVTHGGDADNGVGHCCFSSFPVDRPIPGRLYA